MENVELAYKNESLQKQMAVLERQALEYHAVEKKYKEKIEELETSIKDKNFQMKYYEERFMRVQTEVELSSLELKRLAELNAKYEDTIANWQ